MCIGGSSLWADSWVGVAEGRCRGTHTRRGASPTHAAADRRHASPLHLLAVAYVKYDRASSAAAAIEALHEAVLNEGRGPKIKVMLAESPNTR